MKILGPSALLATFAAISLGLMGCNSESSTQVSTNSSSSTASTITTTALEGTYRVQSWLVSTGDCALPGVANESILDSMAVVDLDSYSFGGYTNTSLWTKSCGSQGACDSLLAGQLNGWFWGQQFSKGSDAIGYFGQTISAGENYGLNNCSGSLEVDTLQVGANKVLTIQMYTTPADTFAKTSDGFCMTDDAYVAVQGNACTRKDVIVLAPVP